MEPKIENKKRDAAWESMEAVLKKKIVHRSRIIPLRK